MPARERRRLREIRPLLRLPRVRVRVSPRAAQVAKGLRERMPRFRGVISFADVLTLGNGLFGFLAIGIVTGIFKPDSPPFLPGLEHVFPGLASGTFFVATVLIVLGMVCDALDGIVARKFGGSRLGADLDTLSDTITFVVTPAFMIYAKYGDDLPFQAYLAAALFLIMGMLRLARFNANPTESSTTTFQGLPTPFAAVTTALLVLAAVPTIPALMVVTLIAFLMMSNVAYPKSRGKATMLALLMVAAALTTMSVILFFPKGQPPVLRGAFTFVILAISLLPFFLARRERLASEK